MVKLIGPKKIRTAVFISGTGSNLKNLIKFSLKKKSPIEIILIISNNVKAKGLNYSKIYKIKKKIYNYNKKKISETKTLKDLKSNNIKLICLAGFMKILSEDFIRRLFVEGGSEPQFAGGGIVNTLASPEATKAQQNAMTNEDLFARTHSPYVQQAAQSPVAQAYFSSPAFQQAMQRQQEFQARQNEAMSQIRMAELDAQQGLADTYSGMEDFQGVGMQ